MKRPQSPWARDPAVIHFAQPAPILPLEQDAVPDPEDPAELRLAEREAVAELTRRIGADEEESE
jgi:hypothetical protein